MDTTHLTQKTNAAAPDRLSLGRPHLPWCGRPCCRPWQDAPPDVRPSGQPAAAFHPSFGCSPPLLPSFLSSPLSSNPPGPLTLLPDNPPNLPARRATHVSLTFRSSDSPNLPWPQPHQPIDQEPVGRRVCAGFYLVTSVSPRCFRRGADRPFWLRNRLSRAKTGHTISAALRTQNENSLFSWRTMRC